VNLQLEESELNFQKNCKEFSEKELPPFCEEIENTGKFPDSLFEKVRSAQLLKPFLPKELGGENLGLFHLTLMVEEIARNIPALAMFIGQQVILGIRTPAKFLEKPDTRDLMKRAACFDDVFSLAVTEDAAGCDLSQISTTIEKTPEGKFCLRGKKAYVNWINRARWVFVLAKVVGGGPNETSVVMLDCSSKGIKSGKIHSTMGFAGIEAAPLEIDEPALTPDSVVGVHGFGSEVFDRVMNEMRIILASIGVGIAQRALDDAIEHGKNRKQFGKPIGSFQSLNWRFSDAAVKVDAARLHVWRALEMNQNKLVSAKQSAIAKVFSAEAANWVADFAVQTLGSKGFIKGSRAERNFRDARFLKICHGSSEILRNLVAAQL